MLVKHRLDKFHDGQNGLLRQSPSADVVHRGYVLDVQRARQCLALSEPPQEISAQVSSMCSRISYLGKPYQIFMLGIALPSAARQPVCLRERDFCHAQHLYQSLG